MFYTSLSLYEISFILFHIGTDRVITSFQMRAARALLGIDQRTLAELAGVSLPTIQRMEASTGTVRGVVESLTKVVEALDRAGVALIGEHARSDEGGRGVRLKEPGPPRRI
jgi:transcriptional regulator with XRE-family HTH domain